MYTIKVKNGSLFIEESCEPADVFGRIQIEKLILKRKKGRESGSSAYARRHVYSA
jgi:hypothetical protein